MIIGIGTDIIETERIQMACRKDSFLNRIYTDLELELFSESKTKGRFSPAGNFAAKEAVAKCLGTGFLGFSPRDIEILREKSGKPIAVLHGGALEAAKALGISKMHLTISHCQSYACSTAIAEAEGEGISFV